MYASNKIKYAVIAKSAAGYNGVDHFLYYGEDQTLGWQTKLEESTTFNYRETADILVGLAPRLGEGFRLPEVVTVEVITEPRYVLRPNADKSIDVRQVLSETIKQGG